ncbi:unnamed protein product [Rotaria sp. Silwood1]|nr:unnamed protein product [Rotaria sp. Silwood1]
MGSGNSVSITIKLDRTNRSFSPGEIVSGRVNVNIIGVQDKVHEIFIKLNGETGYTTTRSISEQDGPRRTVTEHHTTSLFSAKQVFERPTSEQKKLVYHAGNYSWSFEFRLPDQLPPSINQPNEYPHVRYYLLFVIDKPWYKINRTETLYFTVIPRVNLLENPQYLTRFLFGSHNQKELSLKGNINKLGYVPGETIEGTVEIDNPRQIFLKQIYVSLIQHFQIECETRRKTIIQTILPTIVNTKKQRIIERFSVTIPSNSLLPSYEFHGKANVRVYYLLEFDIKADYMDTEFDITVPISLGTETNTKLNLYELHQATNVLPNTVASYPGLTMQNEYPPPNYYFATQ